MEKALQSWTSWHSPSSPHDEPCHQISDDSGAEVCKRWQGCDQSCSAFQVPFLWPNCTWGQTASCEATGPLRFQRFHWHGHFHHQGRLWAALPCAPCYVLGNPLSCWWSSWSRPWCAEFQQMPSNLAEDLDELGRIAHAHCVRPRHPQPWGADATTGATWMQISLCCFGGTLSTWEDWTWRWHLERHDETGDCKHHYSRRRWTSNVLGGMLGDQEPSRNCEWIQPLPVGSWTQSSYVWMARRGGRRLSQRPGPWSNINFQSTWSHEGECTPCLGDGGQSSTCPSSTTSSWRNPWGSLQARRPDRLQEEAEDWWMGWTSSSPCHGRQEPMDLAQRHPYLGRWQPSPSCQRWGAPREWTSRQKQTEQEEAIFWTQKLFVNHIALMTKDNNPMWTWEDQLVEINQERIALEEKVPRGWGLAMREPAALPGAHRCHLQQLLQLHLPDQTIWMNFWMRKLRRVEDQPERLPLLWMISLNNHQPISNLIYYRHHNLIHCNLRSKLNNIKKNDPQRWLRDKLPLLQQLEPQWYAHHWPKQWQLTEETDWTLVYSVQEPWERRELGLMRGLNLRPKKRSYLQPTSTFQSRLKPIWLWQRSSFASWSSARTKSDSHEINYGRASDEMKRKLNESRAKEWSNWLKYKAIRFPTQAEIESLLLAGESVIPMRWVDIDKNEKLRAPGDTTIPEKLQSRLVIRGDLEDGNFRTDCPTASSTAVHILLSYASCKKLKLKSGDISAAFLPGSTYPTCASTFSPSRWNSCGRRPLDLTRGVHDCTHERLRFQRRTSWFLAGTTPKPSSTTVLWRSSLPSTPWFMKENAMDFWLHMWMTFFGLEHLWWMKWWTRSKRDSLLEQRKKGAFAFVAERSWTPRTTFQSLRRRHFPRWSQSTLTEDVNVNLHHPASVSEQSQMRAVLGSIGWVARLCRPELCYGCSSLQGKQAKPTAEDLRNTNKLLASAQKTRDNGVRFVKGKFDFEKAILLSVTDASHAAEVSVTEEGKTQGHRSQSGRFLLLAGAAPTVSQPAWCHVLEWQSQTLKRVCRSTLQAEVLSSMLGSESAQQVRILLYSLKYPRIPGDRGMGWKILAADSKLVLWYSDCRSFIDYMSATTPGSITDKRLAIDMTALRQELWRGENEEIGDPSSSPKMPIDAKDQLVWICTADMLSDQLTKSMRWDSVRNLCDTGCFPLTVSPIRAGFQSSTDTGVWNILHCTHGHEILVPFIRCMWHVSARGPLSQLVRKTCHVRLQQLASSKLCFQNNYVVSIEQTFGDFVKLWDITFKLNYCTFGVICGNITCAKKNNYCTASEQAIFMLEVRLFVYLVCLLVCPFAWSSAHTKLRFDWFLKGICRQSCSVTSQRFIGFDLALRIAHLDKGKDHCCLFWVFICCGKSDSFNTSCN